MKRPSAISRQALQGGVGVLAGHFSKSARSGAPPVISINVKDKPGLYFFVEVTHPPERTYFGKTELGASDQLKQTYRSEGDYEAHHRLL